MRTIATIIVLMMSACAVRAQVVISGNVYGGGNKGDLERASNVVVNGGDLRGKVFGGARMANVQSATVAVNGGKVREVYGGNDISGNVEDGATVIINSSIVRDSYGPGNVYGGGNGSYVYTDQTEGEDLYYDPSSASSPVAALNEKRPHIPQTNIRLRGTAEQRTYIAGAVYCGGNSATLTEDGQGANLELGSYVTVGQLFLGSNGEEMADEEVLAGYADSSRSSIRLTDPAQMAAYMNAVAMKAKPTISFAADYEAYSTHIGSLFCGGNVGSMTVPGTIELDFSDKIVVYEKLVGGCNNANVRASGKNAAFEGGVSVATTDGKPKLVLNIDGLKLEPRQLVYDEERGTFSSDWYIVDSRLNNEQGKKNKLVFGSNIYGGCYNSGHVAGDVVLNIKDRAVEPEKIFRDKTNEHSGVDYNIQSQDVFCKALTAFGGGYGKDSEIRGNTTINISEGGDILQVFGGGEKGLVRGNCTVNLNGGHVEELYGGGFEGDVEGYTQVNLNDGEVYDAFGGACAARVGKYTEVIIGKSGFPRAANIYGGNDFGGSVDGAKTHEGYNGEQIASSTYIAYYHGKIDSIAGGNYGNYDYQNYYNDTDANGNRIYNKPSIVNSFVNIRTPEFRADDEVRYFFGGSEGAPGESDNDGMQQRSYVLVSAPGLNMAAANIYGSGAHAGLMGSAAEPNAAAGSDVWLIEGRVNNVFGASLNEGNTQQTYIHVPAGSTIHANALFGGADGEPNEENIEAIANGTKRLNDTPCDTRRATIDYESTTAILDDAIYGGNNAQRRTQESYVNISVPVVNAEGSLLNVYGAGYGQNSWAACTHINLKDGAKVKNVYGGGRDGMVLNAASETALLASVGERFGSVARSDDGQRNTNVHIHRGSEITANAYGGGYGEHAVVSGRTGITLSGGSVAADIYGGGENAPVRDLYSVKTFTAGTNVDIIGGRVRNTYGGGLRGNVGYHSSETTATTDDVDGETNVTMGIKGAADFYNGSPTIERSLYGGGEKGAVFGTANLTIHNGYVGFKWAEGEAVENLDLLTDGDKLLNENGNAFGGGYDEGGTVDFTNVRLFGGTIRNSLYGGGEIAAIGRGSVTASGEQNSVRVYNGTYKAGKTHIEMHGGHVKRDIFGGGRGYSYNLQGSEISGKEFYTDGYVFGQTEVYIYYGEVGTAEGLAHGYGNVFGGGNIGYVYGLGAKSSESTGSPGHYYYYKGGQLTEDCRVVVKPVSYVLEGMPDITISYTPEDATSPVTRTFTAGEQVPNEALNELDKKETDQRWNSLDVSGVNIRNAVFGGGNVSSGSDKIYANAVTVFGNVTASLRDVFHRDLITIGTEHTGGLYGGGNLSLVEGYRELNITNYGTDYYNFENNKEITIDHYYNELNDRERAYFQLLYKCVTPNNGYTTDQQINQETYDKLAEEFKNDSYWLQAGFCTIYAGRLLNTLQRSDFCGVFGSRMVLQGARDRVTTTVDYTDYTINRIGELSLNQNEGHGNYFGIYSVVNHLGNLTSDISFNSKRVTDMNSYEAASATETYEEYKNSNINNRKRNNGTSMNKVALASGVYLELTTENSSGASVEEKDWGYITGIVELDLINVVPGEGGGYVYARNQHGVRSYDANVENVTLSPYNTTAQTYKRFSYSTTPSEDIQTTGNFVHNVKTEPIIDDCYPSNGNHAAPAHYWFIKGEIYVYEQTISAYTGSATAYAESVRIPLNITAASNGKLKLINVQPNLYAYYATDDRSSVIDGEMKINGVTYHLNDTITYWDYSRLSESNKRRFVPETWVCISDGTVDGVAYKSGQVLLPLTTTPTNVRNKYGEACELSEILRTSNNLAHSNGYLLTIDMNNPMTWNDWYSPRLKADGESIDTKTYTALATDSERDRYLEGPTFMLDTHGVYGQRDYKAGDIIPREVVDNYEAIPAAYMPSDQATVVRAYVSREEMDYTIGNMAYHVEKGADIPKTDYDQLDAATKARFTEAFICTSTITINEANNEFVINGTLLSQDDINVYKAAYILASSATLTEADRLFHEHISEAYRCVAAGKYGGRYYEEPKNYSAIDSWCTISDREAFEFNQDAFDILADEEFKGEDMESSYGRNYCQLTPVDYTAYYTGENDNTPHNGVTLRHNTEYSREDYERLPNERYHYSVITATRQSGTRDYYVVTNSFYNGDMGYIAGQVLTEDVYSRLRAHHESDMTVITLTNNGDADQTFYYCREDYVIGEKGDGRPLTTSAATFAVGSTVPKGTVISETEYATIVNCQQHFVIRGIAPTETSTLYVSRESDIKSLSKDRTFTVIYQYTYDEGDDTGSHIDQISELHVVNIHVKFRSGAPIIGDLSAPPVILPGTTIGMTKPSVTEGAYEIMEGGWEIYRNSEDAGMHRNGKAFVPSETPMYWYQNEKYQVAYYAKTYLGKTFSNYVPVAVANYHDLSEVMSEKGHHMYIDHPDVIRNSKIYLNAAKHEDENQLRLLSQLFKLSKGETLAGHSALSAHVTDCNNLDFFLQSDLTAPSGSWSPIGEPGHCFGGTLHADGYTISGLDHSLFGQLCGSVYNLGVTGSFTSGGVADTGSGHVENCWITTTASPAAGVKAIFSNPDDDSQVENCYYPASGNAGGFTPSAGTHPMPAAAFYNGEVAFDLNGFYLKERFDRNRGSSAAIGDMYVYDRFDDGDFIYADGTIPTKNDIRLTGITSTFNGNVKTYTPLWPDDYLFFGQMLTYGHSPVRPHQPQPTHINKVVTDDDAGGYAPYYHLPVTEQSNRVYRAPAYYRSKTMGVAHFNPWVSLASQSKDGTHEVFPGMTAIDFTGYNDVFNGATGAAISYRKQREGSHFFSPLLDVDGLTAIRNYDLTHNLLVYSPSSDVAADSHEAHTRVLLSEYFTEPAYSEGEQYRTVAINTTGISGHLVERQSKSSTRYVATHDHMLVRKQDFNAPVSYSFAEGKRAWYQRVPDRYASGNGGWEGICLPFDVELVTTQQKGELTHFYQESVAGHEYWLREFSGMAVKTTTDGKLEAKFSYPAATNGNNKEYENTFLWDYYYSQDNQLDANSDTYKQYYAEAHTYERYPHQQNATPYIIGFPGSAYYEFDLSGTWKPANTYGYINPLDRQTITFASEPGGTIGVSDDEMGGVSHNGYTFQPNYLNVTLEPGANAYVLNDAGNAYEKVADTGNGVSIPPFRPYFIAGQQANARSIVFSSEDSSLYGEESNPEESVNGTLTVIPRHSQIVVSSSLDHDVTVSIHATNGILLTSFTIKPGETIKTPVHTSGIYIVNATEPCIDGRGNKKIAVRHDKQI